MVCWLFNMASITLCQLEGRSPQVYTTQCSTVFLCPSWYWLQHQYHPYWVITEMSVCDSTQGNVLSPIMGSEISVICPSSKASVSWFQISLSPSVLAIPLWHFRQVLKGEPKTLDFLKRNTKTFNPPPHYLAQLWTSSLFQCYSSLPLRQ